MHVLHIVLLVLTIAGSNVVHVVHYVPLDVRQLVILIVGHSVNIHVQLIVLHHAQKHVVVVQISAIHV
jgi:hypothetical protein